MGYNFLYIKKILDSAERNGYIRKRLNMKMARIGKIIGIFLLIVFALQVTDLTCFGESSFKMSGTQNGFQLKTSDLDNGNGIYASTAGINNCQCPCHLSFSSSPFLTITSTPTDSLVILTNRLSIHKISIDLFQPPEAII